MKARLLEREWSIIIILFTLIIALIVTAYLSKDSVDPVVEEFFKGKKVSKRGNFDCTK